jgi:preprotein translocase subunit SecF
MIKRTPNFDFMKHHVTALAVSSALSLVCLLFLLSRGLNLGVDFTGGVIVEAAYTEVADLESIRSALRAAGFTSAQAQSLGRASDVVIRLPPLERPADITDARDRVLGVLRAQDPFVEIRRFETIGSQVGEDLAERAAVALLLAMAIMFIYVSLRFRWKFAVGASVAEIHDVLITIGLFSVAGWPFDLTVLGAMLAVLGYSINDKIVVFDRIRDNLRLMRHGTTAAIVNSSINQVLSRTLVTGVTTLLVLVALIAIAGETMFGFAIALIVGILVGTYSSIFVASALTVVLKITPSDMVAAKAKHDDGMP